MADDDEAPGWDAIETAIASLVEGREPLHWGTATSLPDQDGLWGISAYDQGSHWFFVTYGLSELFTKVSDDPLVSGWGEELTMRLHRDSEAPPDWAVRVLARLGELVFQRAAPFLPGGRIEIPDPANGAPPALAWIEDPELAPIATPFGSVQFVATVGISQAQVEAMRASSTATVLDAVRANNPLLIVGRDGLIW